MAIDAMKATPDQSDRLHRFAHDLRNRLAAMHQAVGHLESSANAETRELIDYAEQQYFKAMRATETLLDDLGVERGVIAISPVPVELDLLVQRAVHDLQHRFERKQQTVGLTAESGIVVNGDPHWLDQLVGALITNASKFSPNGSPITITLSRSPDSAILTVVDKGVGLDQADLDLLFMRYAMPKSRSTNGEPQGRSTLARALQWAQVHGGSLIATSEGPGHGSSFVLSLPLAK